jgi:hypothetical protein
MSRLQMPNGRPLFWGSITRPLKRRAYSAPTSRAATRASADARAALSKSVAHRVGQKKGRICFRTAQKSGRICFRTNTAGEQVE